MQGKEGRRGGNRNGKDCFTSYSLHRKNICEKKRVA